MIQLIRMKNKNLVVKKRVIIEKADENYEQIPAENNISNVFDFCGLFISHPQSGIIFPLISSNSKLNTKNSTDNQPTITMPE